MVSVVARIFPLFPLFFLSCAKIGYLYKQSIGQFRLIYEGRLNQEVLDDPKVSPKDKVKIEKIVQYKKWFYEYWGEPESGIYSKTTFLKEDAVSYLLIASPYNRIEAKKECFPLVGCFPYLGFFEQKDALARAKKLEKDNWSTWIRPVYAYSSLGKFNDRILSSFFHYDDRDLAELVFHELFHTLLFIKNEVEFNENLANFFATQMRRIYFEEKDSLKKEGLLPGLILEKIDNLKVLYAQEKDLTKSGAKKILDDFLQTEFYPSLLKYCDQYNISPCRFAQQRDWNNARFAAFLTYQNQEKKIYELFQYLKKKEESFSVKKFFIYIKDRYNGYKAEKKEMSFGDYLLKRV